MNHENKISFIVPDLLFYEISEQLVIGRSVSFTVTGMSMWPFICHRRDQVIVKACDKNNLRVGDIILFQTPYGNYILHRITSLKKDYFETTGDGNCFRDGWFSRDCVVAKVDTIIRKGKSISCDSLPWTTLFWLWRIMYPIRPQLLRFLRRVGRLKARYTSVTTRLFGR